MLVFVNLEHKSQQVFLLGHKIICVVFWSIAFISIYYLVNNIVMFFTKSA